MSQTKEEIEAELKAFKDANPGWMANSKDREFVQSYNNRLATFPPPGNDFFLPSDSFTVNLILSFIRLDSLRSI